MSAKNISKEWRAAKARRNFLANEVCGLLAAGMKPDRNLLSEWEAATQRLSRLEAKHQEQKEQQT